MDMMVSAEHPYQAILMRDLQAQIKSLKLEESGDESPNRNPVYEVFTQTEAAKFAHLSKVNNYGVWFPVM